MDRHWLLTSTFHGNWLPGDRRGSVTRVRERRPNEPPSKTRREHDAIGTDFDCDLAGLRLSALLTMKGDPIQVHADQARELSNQFLETAQYRRWQLLAFAVMCDHVHWMVGVPGDPEPEDLLRDFKAYGSRALNKHWSRPESGTWWTQSGSKRKRQGERSIQAAVIYVAFKQPKPLAVYLDPTFVVPAKLPRSPKALQ